jgi:ATP-binding cassette subfamily B protein
MFHTRFGKFFSYYKPYRRLFAADIFSAMVVSAISLVLPLCIRYITRDILSFGLEDITERIFQTGLLMLVLIFIQTGCALFYDHMGHVMGA